MIDSQEIAAHLITGRDASVILQNFGLPQGVHAWNNHVARPPSTHSPFLCLAFYLSLRRSARVHSLARSLARCEIAEHRQALARTFALSILRINESSKFLEFLIHLLSVAADLSADYGAEPVSSRPRRKVILTKRRKLNQRGRKGEMDKEETRRE